MSRKPLIAGNWKMNTTPDDRVRLGVCDRLGDGLRAVGVDVLFEHAHGPVPEDRPGLGELAAVAFGGPGTDVEAHEAWLESGHGPGLVIRVEGRGDDVVLG